MDGRKRRGSAFLLVIALLAGVALGYCLSPGASSAPPPQADKEKAAKRPLADAGEAATIKALRARIAELERQLAERSAEKLPDMVTAVTNAVAEVRAGRGNPFEWMENIKKNDPERYTQMTNRFEQFRRRNRERQQRNLDFLASIDTSRMSASAKKTHAALQDAIARRAELDEKMRQEDLSQDERHEIFEQMMSTDRQLRGLRRAERNNLFEATATSLGFEGADAKEIVSTLNEVVDATENHGRRMGPPGGGWPLGGGGPRPLRQ